MSLIAALCSEEGHVGVRDQGCYLGTVLGVALEHGLWVMGSVDVLSA